MTTSEARLKRLDVQTAALPAVRAEVIKQLRKLAEYETDGDIADICQAAEVSILRMIEERELAVSHISRNVLVIR